MIWCGILYKKSNWRQEKINYRQVFSIRHICFIIGIAFGGCLVLSIGIGALADIFPKFFESYNDLMSNFDTSSNSAFGVAITLLYSLVIGPVSEELIFRGAIFDRLHVACQFWIANAIQAALFGLYHLNLIQGAYAFLLGMVLGMIVYATGSILASILTHILFNSTSYLLSAVLGINIIMFRYVAVFILLVIIVTGFKGICYFYRRCQEKMKTEEVNL